jgi:cell pole-organizing protein PopZ
MNPTNNIATDLFYKIRSRFRNLKLGSESGEITINPSEARFFDFDYMEGETPIGHVSISLAEENSMKVYFSTGITETMDRGQKDNWYGFLKELRQFAKRRLMAFDTRDIAKDNLDQRDFAFLSQNAQTNSQKPTTAPVGESVMNESTLYGTKTVSYQKLMDTRLIIKHSKTLEDDLQPGARTRNISALFVENQDGERFKYPFIHLAGARAMQRHVANSGLPYDQIGQSIIKMSEEIAQLRSFSNYVVRNDLMNSETNSIVERSSQALDNLREQIKALSKQSHYEAYIENFQAYQQDEVPQEIAEEFKEKFTVKNFKEDIASVFPVLYRLMKEGNTIGYSDIVDMNIKEESNEDIEVDTEEEMYDPFSKFESWVLSLGEESAISSSDEDEQQSAIKELQELVGEHFPAGVDGSNAIESLRGIIEDPQLFKSIKDQAKEDPDSCVRPLIKDWLEQNSPEVVDQLDFGDMVDENWKKKIAAATLAGSMALGGAAHANDDKKTDKIDSDQKVVQVDKSKKDSDTVSPADAEKVQLKLRPSFKKPKTEDDETNIDVRELAEFISSFYDKDSGTFPKGPEGVCTMVGKKFGEQAESVARKFVERMAPMQTTENNPELQELARIRELAKF